MQVAGRFRAVRRGDCVFSGSGPQRLSPKGGSLDIMVFHRGPQGSRQVPLLLVGASRRTGGAVERNKFRRRVRMAFLAVLRKGEALPHSGFALWVRPAKGATGCRLGCRIGYKEIAGQIEASLARLVRP